ncbi:MAG: RHS repeat-associated core domain-containing protein, partial [Bacteroidota bacterium]
PFGLTHTGAWFATVAPEDRYRYNGKELDEATGLYDYGARYYDPAIARWTSVDPLAEVFAPWSPYNYVLGNPLLLVDRDGRLPEPPKWLEKARTFLKGIARSLGINTGVGTGNRNTPRNARQARRQEQANAAVRHVEQGLQGMNDLQETFIPGVSIANELREGDAKGALIEGGIAIGAGIIIPVGGSKISSLLGKGKDVLSRFVQKFSNQASHLTDMDVSGALRDIMGDPVIRASDGYVYDHLKEVTEALDGLGRELGNLNRQIDAGTFTDEVLEQAQTLRSNLQRQKDALQDLLRRTQEKAE